MTRRIDELGRLVIPKEIRRNLKIKSNDQFEISILDDKIMLSKYESLDKDKIVIMIVHCLKKYLKKNIIITSRDSIIEYDLLNNKKLNKITLNEEVMNIIEKRKTVISSNTKLNIIEKNYSSSYIISPIIIKGDIYGSIIIFGEDEITNKDIYIIEFINVILENYLE